MASQIKLASAFVELTVNRSQMEAGIAIAMTRLNQLKAAAAIPLSVNRSQATAALLGVQSQLKATGAQAAATASQIKAATAGIPRNAAGQFVPISAALGRDPKSGRFVSTGAGGMLGKIGGMSGAATGLAQGLGIGGFAVSPAQIIGQLVGSGLAGSVGTAIDLEATFADLQRVSGLKGDEIAGFKQRIFQIGQDQAGSSIKDLTDIAGVGARMGVADKEGVAGLETFTRAMARVRNAVTGIGTEQLANDMGRVLGLFGKGTDYVESFGSVLTRMDNVSKSSAADILDISKGLSGTARSLQMTIPQLLAFSSVLSDVGLTNQQGASSFSQILRMMASDSADFATKIGAPVEHFQQLIRTDVMGALQMVIDKFRELNNADPIKAQEFVAGLGFRGVKTAGALQQLATQFEEVQRRTVQGNEQERTKGDLIASDKINSGITRASVQKFENASVQAGERIGSFFTPVVDVAAGVGAKVMRLIADPRQKAGLADKAPGAIDRNAEAAEADRLFAAQEAAGKRRQARATPQSIAAIMADDRRRQAEGMARLLGGPAETVQQQAAREVGPAGKGEKSQEEHARNVFLHARRIQAERDAADADKDPEAAKRDRANKLKEKVGRFGAVGLSALFGTPEQKLGLAAQGATKLAGMADKATGGAVTGMLNAIPEKPRPKFESRSFGDLASFGNDAIRSALSEKDDEGVKEQKKTNDHLEKLREDLKKGRGGKDGVTLRGKS